MTTHPLDPLLALSALSEKATAGSWTLGALGPPKWRYLWGGDSVVAAVSEWTEEGVLVGNLGGLEDAEAHANALFIVNLVNWFRANASDLRAANARGDGLIAAIEFALADAVNGQIREAGFNRLRAALTAPVSEVRPVGGVNAPCGK